MRKTIVATTLAVIAASALMLNGCGKKAEAEAVTTAAVETTAAAEETTAEETTTAAEETTAAAEETTAAAEETTAAAEESSESEEESTEESSKEEETTEETTKEETTTAEETTVEETTAEETKAQSSGADPSAIYSQVTGLLPGMINVDANYIANYYGIDASQLEGYVFAMAEDVTHADTVAILKAKDASSVAALAGQLSAVQQQKAQELQDYMPDQYQIVAASSVKTAGNYVYLVMSPNAAAIEQTIASNIG
ncbi:DUF4358 domain-containing protein [Oribacterium sp. FC2011]|uniref:DUF4358 domain-containing protein n=1 Tax=Oribacterium sp. FC2011 TaxID=1408311 RepID=UPI000678A0E1|nr:DUF4358 domain-containing protein [Oribacterium sp. FC2011]